MCWTRSTDGVQLAFFFDADNRKRLANSSLKIAFNSGESISAGSAKSRSHTATQAHPMAPVNDAATPPDHPHHRPRRADRRDPDAATMKGSLEHMPIFIDRVLADEDEQIADHVTEDKNHQHGTGECDEDFLANRGTNEAGERRRWGAHKETGRERRGDAHAYVGEHAALRKERNGKSVTFSCAWPQVSIRYALSPGSRRP